VIRQLSLATFFSKILGDTVEDEYYRSWGECETVGIEQRVQY
jgi:hypothetical protein